MEDNTSLKDLKIDYNKLRKQGFNKENDYYLKTFKILKDQFLLVIKISEDNQVTSYVVDSLTNERYVPYFVKEAGGNLISKMRDEYNNIIKDIKKTCCVKNVFKGKNANLVIKYVKEKYGDDLEYLWEKFPNYAVLRNKSNNKWYGVLMVISKLKLGANEDEMVEIIDLLLEPERIEKLVDNKKYFKGYHMNKKHWITIMLDGSVKINEIYDLIDNSFKISENK